MLSGVHSDNDAGWRNTWKGTTLLNVDKPWWKLDTNIAQWDVYNNTKELNVQSCAQIMRKTINFTGK